MKLIKRKIRIRLKIRSKIPKLESAIIYSKKIAQRFHDTGYYEAMQSEIKNLPQKDNIKKLYSTKKKQKVTSFLSDYNTKLNIKSEGIFRKLKSIYYRNQMAAFYNEKPPVHSNLLYLVSSVPMLIVAYSKIRKNKGATTSAFNFSNTDYEKLEADQKSFINKTTNMPDGISRETFIITCNLLRKGKYPWGSSRRIYVDKPGKPDVKRPVTIPPFMDKVVQCSITLLLNSIYEPWFEKTNVSFGFRPNKGVHDAIYSLSTNKSRGLNKAIEGDIKAAYDKVCKEKLLHILGRKIKDRKFLELIKMRLNYQYWDSLKKTYVKDKEGVPQGGIDSPYLWNIYMMDFDDFVLSETKKFFWESNQQIRKDKPLKNTSLSPERRKIERLRRTTKWMINVLNHYSNDPKLVNFLFTCTASQRIGRKDVQRKTQTPVDLHYVRDISSKVNWNYPFNLKETKFNLIKYNSELNHQFFKMPATESGRLHLRFLYARYADDWILITNAPQILLEKLKLKYKEFLYNELKATLAEDKTLLTDMKKEPAHFLGFEFKVPAHSRISKYNKINKDGIIITIKANTAGKELYVLPDRHRLISRLHMKGYCNKKGFPKEVGWLSYLEPHIIIERFNSVLRGFANYYTEFIGLPERQLSRWIYIIRYSCLKTLAQKFNTSIKKIFEKFKYRKKWSDSNEKTIECVMIHNINGNTYKKRWKLLTLKELIQDARDINRLKSVASTFWSLEKGIPVAYESTENNFPGITSYNFLDKITWVNLRTQASLDAPCCICGSEDQVQMHHLRSIRKQRFELIPAERIWERTMSLRNRKQIPVCRECHMNLIHKGKYGGTKLDQYVPKILYDNRLISLESHIHKGIKNVNYTKTLEEKGWIKIEHQNQDKGGDDGSPQYKVI